MSKLKFAILGCGRISSKHVEALANNFPEAELVAACDIIEERAKKCVEQYISLINEKSQHANDGVAISLDVEMRALRNVNYYIDYKEMIRKEDIDIVAIATESGYHAKHSVDCLNANKHVLVEKPMALSSIDADKMIKLAKKKGLKLGVCHQNRFNPPIQKLRKAIEEGRFGKIVNGTARILWNRNNDYYKQAPWRGTKALDGGTLMNQCIHNIDLLQWMMDSEVERVYAERGTFLRNIEMEDFGAILIRFKNGAIGIVEGSACVYPKNLEETLSIFGEKGTVVIGGLAVNEVKTWMFEEQKDYDEEHDNIDINNVYGEGHIQLYKDFINAINNNTEPLINGEEGRKAMEIVLSAYK